MRITFTPLPEDCPVIIVPVLKTAALKQTLHRIAEAYSLPLEWLHQDFKADAKDSLSFYGHPSPTQKVYLLGLGSNPNGSDVLTAVRQFVFVQKARLGRHVGIDWRRTVVGDLPTHFLTTMIQGIEYGSYPLGMHKTDGNGVPPLRHPEAALTLIGDEMGLAEAVKKGVAVAKTQMRILDLVNAPSNYKPPRVLAAWAVDSGKQFGFETTVFDKERCEKEKLHALLSVNKGSAEEPRFIIMEYLPQGATDKKLPKIGLVGKGITFDTGGISIKPSSGMHKMKSDMGGAAAVLGTMELVARLQLPVHLIGIVPSTENMVDGKGTKPGDVVGSYLGKTIEVIDTDAEGRIILADGLGYMVKNYQPDVVIDLATLTGSVIGTFGYQCAGLFSNDDALADKLSQIGEITGERVWRLPLWEVYAEDLKSDVADVANFSGKPMAGAISAAKFLELFTDKHPKWAHLDIAGVALLANEIGIQPNATGYGIRLLTEWIISHIS